MEVPDNQRARLARPRGFLIIRIVAVAGTFSGMMGEQTGLEKKSLTPV
jgi:hypothetical protein